MYICIYKMYIIMINNDDDEDLLLLLLGRPGSGDKPAPQAASPPRTSRGSFAHSAVYALM